MLFKSINVNVNDISIENENGNFTGFSRRIHLLILEAFVDISAELLDSHAVDTHLIKK